MTFRFSLLVFLGLAMASRAALADDVYRWTDASGAVSYGQKPPADAHAVRKVQTDGINVIPSASNAASDQKLAESFAKSRAERLQQEAAESHIAAEKARADLDRQTALLEAQRAVADAGCAASTPCSDQSNVYYPLYGPTGGRGYYPGYGGYGNGYGSPSGPIRPRPPQPATNTGGLYPNRTGAALN